MIMLIDLDGYHKLEDMACIAPAACVMCRMTTEKFAKARIAVRGEVLTALADMVNAR